MDKPLQDMTLLTRTLAIASLAVLVAVPAIAQQSEVGYASWYNRGFNGLSTASGESYNHEALTAAHPSLPFGTILKVTRTDDGRSVLVRVNDRMESGPGHVIDLSGAAARDLGLLETGVARVRIEGAGVADSRPSTSENSYTEAQPQPANTAWDASPVPSVQYRGTYTLQLGVFSTKTAAQDMAARVEGAWIQPVNAANGTMYRVYFKSFDAETAARNEQARLGNAGYDSFLRNL